MQAFGACDGGSNPPGATRALCLHIPGGFAFSSEVDKTTWKINVLKVGKRENVYNKN